MLCLHTLIRDISEAGARPIDAAATPLIFALAAAAGLVKMSSAF